MKRSLVALAAAMTLLAAACGNGDDDVGDSEAMATELQEQAVAEGDEISLEEAECVAELLVAFLGESEAQDLIDSGFESDEPHLEESMIEALSDPELSDRVLEIGDQCPEWLRFTEEDLETIQEMGEASEAE